ncbi:hypothetical protein [Ideonella alba]|uniref:Uncharacterized protein n=1 Tax=Ideonella alba TaxID=2824118 RepID=A0A940Y2L0_9BURK|nr:hypothetical protein [Ideonella alba]MBQ0929184.1 hypothetical protein [Ideonella alba]
MQEKNEPIVGVYCESAPLAEQYVTYGLQRALVPVVLSLGSIIDKVYIFPRDGFVRSHRILPEVRAKVTVANNFAAKVAARLESKHPTLALKIFSLAMAMAEKAASPNGAAKYIIGVIGANTQSLIRANEFAKRQSATLLCYFVDEIDHPKASTSNRRSESNSLLDSLGVERRSIKGFSITQELAALLKSRHGFETTALPLPYIISEPEREKISQQRTRADQLIYIGALNFLYKSSLATIVNELLKYNINRTCPTKLRLTVTRDIAERQLGPLPDWVICEPIPERIRMLEEIAKSRAALMPCSFDAESASMVSTSFPSKFLDYLAAARDIYVLAPSYSSIAKYLKSLPEIGVEHEPSSISSFLSKSDEYQPGRFQAVLEQRHSLHRFAAAAKGIIQNSHASPQ